MILARAAARLADAAQGQELVLNVYHIRSAGKHPTRSLPTSVPSCALYETRSVAVCVSAPAAYVYMHTYNRTHTHTHTHTQSQLTGHL